MDKSAFSNILAHISEYSLEDKLEIMAEKNRYPYCALLQVCDLMSDKAVSLYRWEDCYKPLVMIHVPEPAVVESLLEQVQPTAVNTADDKRLFEQIQQLKADYEERRANHAAETPTAAEQPAQEEPRQEKSSNEPVDVMREINDFQEVSFKTAPKSEILSKFLEVGSIKVDDNPMDDEAPVEVLAKKSIVDSGTVETETLAQIYEKQGKFERAVAAYERLMERYPDKKEVYSKKIDDLLEVISNRKK